MFYTKKQKKKLRKEVYSVVGAATAVNAGIGITAVVMSGKSRKDIKTTKEKINDIELHVSKEEEQLSKITKAVRTIQDCCLESGLLRK